MSNNKNEENDNIISFKIMVYGDSGTGKSEIIKKFINQKFDKLKNESKIKLNITDTSGQEKYGKISISYIKNSDGILFVFSHDDIQSFYNIKELLEQLKNSTQSIDFKNTIPAYLVGNKCDLEHEIDDDEIQDAKKDNNFYGYIDISANDDIGINRVFEEMGEMLFKIYGKRKRGHNVKLAAKVKKHKRGCTLCRPDV